MRDFLSVLENGHGFYTNFAFLRVVAECGTKYGTSPGRITPLKPGL